MPLSNCVVCSKKKTFITFKTFIQKLITESLFCLCTAYFKSKDLAKRTISHKILKDRAYEIAMKLLIVTLMHIKEHLQVYFIRFLLRKQDRE